MIIIGEKLNWEDHILHVSNKISKATGVIIKPRILGKKALLSEYYSLIYPYLTYCCQVWGATFLYNIEILNRLQKKVIRIICSETKYAHTESLFKELKTLDVTNIYNYLVGQFMYRNHNNLLPDLFDSYFTNNRTTHYYETRQRNFFRILEYKTNLGKRSIRYTGVKMWIEVIESKIDVECSLSVFKQNLKQCLTEKIICLHCSKMQWWFAVFFLLLFLTFVMQANRIPFVTLCCTFGTIIEIVWSESDIGTH